MPSSPSSRSSSSRLARAAGAERMALLDTYRGFEKHQFPDPARLTGAELHQYLVLRGGIRAEEGAIEWLSEVLSALGGVR